MLFKVTESSFSDSSNLILVSSPVTVTASTSICSAPHVGSTTYVAISVLISSFSSSVRVIISLNPSALLAHSHVYLSLKSTSSSLENPTGFSPVSPVVAKRSE